ncbi:MAG: rhomboid family intramembrane serine protease [Planctomycetaceae bacterium]|nr:rhomboid family intramembrane serine protease [Planctomycetaceae bacterium]
MGLEERDYAREYESGFSLRAPQSMVGTLILINVGVFLLDVVLQGRISDRAELASNLFSRPWNVWQLVTYGFLHDTHDLFHILFNMLGLFFFGRDLEAMYGKWEFLRLYLGAIIFGGLVWVAAQTFIHHNPVADVVGASAGIAAIVILFALHFPRRMLLFWGFIPVPAWALGAFIVVTNMLGAFGAEGSTAYEAHLGGIAFALAYYRFHWNIGRWLPRSFNLGSLPRRTFGARSKLRLHQPQDEAAPPVNLDAEVDRILSKIHNSGQDSLTDAERKLLERASARYQRRRQ